MKRDEQNDAIIGRAFRWSFTAIVVIALIVGAVVYFVRRDKPEVPQQVTPLTPPELRSAPPAEIPRMPFTDITREAGITFTHANGARGEKLLPETMGGGVAFSDVDNDGDADLLFVNGTDWPWSEPGEAMASYLALFEYNGKGEFSDVTESAGLQVSLWRSRRGIQVEYNRVRPYTYSHFNPTASYSHYGQP
ncbi:MAG: VCBS repeat-containing protein, partial [Verrucomicrobiota bacterium]